MTNWETCVQFHGHACGGLTIGYKAACYAAELLELSFSGDEQVVCIAENDACGVDAIQALLGCSIGGVARGLISDRQPAAGVAVKLYAGFPVGHDLVSFSSSSMSTSLCPCTSTMLPVTP